MLQSPTIGPTSWMKISPIEILVTRACEPTNPTMYSILKLQSTLIRRKLTSSVFVSLVLFWFFYDNILFSFFLWISPREAAMAIGRLANHRNPHVAILALALLDTLVQSCGYPFHLQISTKEFLNELVRRFPERPPPFPGPVMSRILELIGGWKEGICTESR
jgi:ADP-ribosylation factor-binding protein GGA